MDVGPLAGVRRSVGPGLGEVAHWRASSSSSSGPRTRSGPWSPSMWARHGSRASSSSALDLLGQVDLDASLTRTMAGIRPPRRWRTTSHRGFRRGDLDRHLHPPEERIRIGHGWSYTAANFWDATTTSAQPQPPTPSSASPVPSLSVEAAVRTCCLVDVVDRDPLDTSTGARRVQALTDFAGYPLVGHLSP